jgi:hypothetical protein
VISLSSFSIYQRITQRQVDIKAKVFVDVILGVKFASSFLKIRRTFLIPPRDYAHSSVRRIRNIRIIIKTSIFFYLLQYNFLRVNSYMLYVLLLILLNKLELHSSNTLSNKLGEHLSLFPGSDIKKYKIRIDILFILSLLEWTNSLSVKLRMAVRLLLSSTISLPTAQVFWLSTNRPYRVKAWELSNWVICIPPQSKYFQFQ